VPKRLVWVLDGLIRVLKVMFDVVDLLLRGSSGMLNVLLELFRPLSNFFTKRSQWVVHEVVHEICNLS
jgi:hypothetical protein